MTPMEPRPQTQNSSRSYLLAALLILAALNAEIRQLGGSVDSLLKVKQQLEVDKRELRNVNSFDSRKYDKKIRNYQALLAQKDQEIARLKEENGVLSQQNEAL